MCGFANVECVEDGVEDAPWPDANLPSTPFEGLDEAGTVLMTTFCWALEAALPFGNNRLVLSTGFEDAALIGVVEGAGLTVSAGLLGDTLGFCLLGVVGFFAASSLASRLARSSSLGDGIFGLGAFLGTIRGCLWMRTSSLTPFGAILSFFGGNPPGPIGFIDAMATLLCLRASCASLLAFCTALVFLVLKPRENVLLEVLYLHPVLAVSLGMLRGFTRVAWLLDLAWCFAMLASRVCRLWAFDSSMFAHICQLRAENVIVGDKRG